MTTPRDDRGLLEQRVALALERARATATSAAALDALSSVHAWNEELTSADPLARALLTNACQALNQRGHSAFDDASDAPPRLLEQLDHVLDWLELATTTPHATPWLDTAEALVARLLPPIEQGALSFTALTHGSHSLHHTVRATADRHPALGARCEGLWARWAHAAQRHPLTRQALALRAQVAPCGWRYADLASRVRGLGEREGADDEPLLEWVLGAAPLPFGPGDEAEAHAGRHGYAHSEPEAVVQALDLLQLAPHDVFYDLGAGLGLPCVIAALRGATVCRGVEVHAAYVNRARDNARVLGLANVTFDLGDVTQLDWSDGTAFYLFNAFPPTVLAVVAARLRELATHKPIRVACFHNTLGEGFVKLGGHGALAVYRAA